MKRTVESLSETRSIAHEILSRKDKGKGARIITLSGNLGAGKTAFAKEVAGILGVQENVPSPTFVLMRVYSIPRGNIFGKQFSRLAHIDAYRIHGKDLDALGWEELIAHKETLVLLEWPERVQERIPKSAEKISFKLLPKGKRIISW